MEHSSCSSFLALPFEIRRQVYLSMLEGQIVHCCPDESHLNHPPATRQTPSMTEGIQQGLFYDNFWYCSGRFYEGPCYATKWTHITMPGCSLPALSDILNFFLSCKVVWNELEPLLWKYVTLCVGLPHFAGFYKQFLSMERLGHSITTPRAHLIQRLSLAMVREADLNSNMSRNRNITHLNCQKLIESVTKQSIGYLTRHCTGLRDLSVLVRSPTEGQDLGPGGIAVVDLGTCHTLVQFKELKSFSLIKSTEAACSPRNYGYGRFRYPITPPNEPVWVALDITHKILADMMTREDEPSCDGPPGGILWTDPDYLWLRAHFEGNHRSYARLAELVLRTKVALQERGISTPPIEGNMLF